MKKLLAFSILFCYNSSMGQTIVPYLRMKNYQGKIYFVDSTTIKPVNKKGYDYDWTVFTSAFSDGMMMVMLNKKFGFVNDRGEEVIAPLYDEAYPFHEGMAAVRNNKAWGFIDKTGKEMVAPRYELVYSFKEGLAAVKKDGKWGFVDKTGKEVVPPKYTDIGYPQYYGKPASSGRLPELVCGFFDGRCTVSVNNKWGYIDKEGKEIVPLKFQSVYNFDHGLAMVEIADYKTGLINTAGKMIIPAIYGGIFLRDDLILVSAGNHWGCLNSSGKVIVATKYDQLSVLDDKLFGFALKDKVGIIDKTGKILFQTSALTSILSGYNDIFLVSKGDKMGFINSSGKIVIPIQYDDIKMDPKHALMGFKKGNKYGFMDKSGKEVVPAIYDEIKEFSEGMAPVKQKEQWGFINEKGTLAIPFKYKNAESFINGWAKVRLGAYFDFFIDRMGREYMDDKNN
jgi:hypothetical protein